MQTVQLVHISGSGIQGGPVEINATWEIDWHWPAQDQSPKIARVITTAHERAEFSQPAFEDCTRSALKPLGSIFDDQFGVGIGSWVRQIESYVGPLQTGMNGLAIGDVNGDGLEDVYVCQTGGLPNRLLLHQPDGTVQDASAKAGVDYLEQTTAALFIDADNDGDQDLVLAQGKKILILGNDGTGRFQLAQVLSEVHHTHSLAAADYDLDGDLDLYACAYNSHGETAGELPVPMPVYDALNGGRNLLLQNEGGLQFKDVTARTGLDQKNSRFSFAAVWEDYDRDGHLDLYVANDFGVNNLYRNLGNGRFSEVTGQVGMGAGAFGMSASAADYDRDGWVDFYKANMYSSAGNRVATQNRFMPAASATHRQRMLELAEGNTLYRNVGGKFVDVAGPAGVAMGRWSWGSVFIDINNDGWEDIFVANGYVTGENLDDL